MKNLIILLSILISNLSFAQNPKINPYQNDKFVNCDLFKKNVIWWKEIETETNKTKKIELVKKKIFADTIYKKDYPENKTVLNPYHYNIDENGNICGVKILFLVKYNKRDVIIDLLEQPKYVDILNEINSENIEIFLIPATEGGMAIYGRKGSSGVVYMTVNDKKLKRKIKKYCEIKKTERPTTAMRQAGIRPSAANLRIREMFSFPEEPF